MASFVDKLLALAGFKPKGESGRDAALKIKADGTFRTLSEQYLSCEDEKERAQVFARMCRTLPDTLFLAAMCFEGEDPNVSVRDRELHATTGAKKLYAANEAVVTKGNPGYRLAKKADRRRIHLRTLVSNRTKEVWVPLFTDFNALLPVFGKNFRITLISFDEARQMAKSYKGIMINPGSDVIRLDHAELKKVL